MVRTCNCRPLTDITDVTRIWKSGTGTNLIRWVDKKLINFISTYAAVNPVGKAMRWNSAEKKKTPILRPDVVAEYNSFMGGVDLADMLIELYRIDRRNCKWYMRIIWWILGVALVNSWLLSRKSNKLSLMDFHADVAYGLLLAKKAVPGDSGSGKKRGRPPLSSPLPAEEGSKARRQLPITDVRLDRVDHWKRK